MKSDLVKKYNKLLMEWSLAREESGGTLTEGREIWWTSKVQDIWDLMSDEERDAADSLPPGSNFPNMVDVNVSIGAVGAQRVSFDKYIENLKEEYVSVKDIKILKKEYIAARTLAEKSQEKLGALRFQFYELEIATKELEKEASIKAKYLLDAISKKEDL